MNDHATRLTRYSLFIFSLLMSCRATTPPPAGAASVSLPLYTVQYFKAQEKKTTGYVTGTLFDRAAGKRLPLAAIRVDHKVVGATATGTFQTTMAPAVTALLVTTFFTPRSSRKPSGSVRVIQWS